MAEYKSRHESPVIFRLVTIPPQEFDASNPEHRQVCMYAGLEEAEYLIEDLEQVLEIFK